MNLKFELLETEALGIIELNNKVRISDPCYSVDEWCAGTLENVLPGTYHCFYQKVDCGDWGTRIASIEVRHESYLDIEPTEVTNIDVGVDERFLKIENRRLKNLKQTPWCETSPCYNCGSCEKSDY